MSEIASLLFQAITSAQALVVKRAELKFSRGQFAVGQFTVGQSYVIYF